MAKQYVVSDGTLMLILEPAEEGGYNVSSPLDPQLFTQAETLEDAFANAYDVKKLLRKSRAELAKKYRPAGDSSNHAAKQAKSTEGDPLKGGQANPDDTYQAGRRSRRKLLG